MDLTALKTELTTDPAGMGYAALLAAGSVADVLHRINDPSPQRTCRDSTRPKWELIRWAAGNDRRGKIARAAATTGVAQGLALTAQDCLSLDTFNVDEPGVGQVLDGLVALGVLDSTDRTAFAALGDRTPASRAEALWGGGVVVSQDDVLAALR